MAHEPAIAFQQSRRIRQRGPLKEAYVYVRSEYVDVAEGRISQTCDRTAVMQKLADFVPAFPHHLKPPMRDGSQFSGMLFHPRINGGVPFHRAVESQQIGSRHEPVSVCRQLPRRPSPPPWSLANSSSLPAGRRPAGRYRQACPALACRPGRPFGYKTRCWDPSS